MERVSLSDETLQRALIEKYTSYRQARKNQEEEEANKHAFLEKYNRMLSARKNRSTYYEHQCEKRKCNPMTEAQMVSAGLLSHPRNGGGSYSGGGGSTNSPRISFLDSTMFVCEYGTMHLCNKNVPPSWYKETVPYSPCDLVTTHTGEICCQISGSSLGYKQALPFMPASGKDGILAGAVSPSTKVNQQEEQYDDVSGFNHGLKVKQQQQQQQHQQQTKNKSSVTPGVLEPKLRGPKLSTRAPPRVRQKKTAQGASHPIDGGGGGGGSKSLAFTKTTSPQDARSVLNSFKDIKITTMRNREKLQSLHDKDKEETDEERKKKDERKRNAIVVKRKTTKTNSTPRCKKVPFSSSNAGGGGGGKVKQKRQKQKPRIEKLMHEKLDAKIEKKYRQIRREKIREGAIPIPKRDKNNGELSVVARTKLSDVFSSKGRKRKRCDESEEREGEEEEEEEEEKKEEKEREGKELEGKKGEKLEETNPPVDQTKESKTDPQAQKMRPLFGRWYTPKIASARMGKEELEALERSREKIVRDARLTPEEKHLKTIATSLVMDLFFSEKRTAIYERSTRVPRNKGESAVKSKWAKATKEYKEHQRLLTAVDKKIYGSTGCGRGGGGGKGGNNAAASAKSNAIKGKKTQPQRNTSPNLQQPVKKTLSQSDLDLIASIPPYVGFNSISGFTTYRNAVIKHTKIKKTPRLPVNEDFIEFFVKHSMLQWSIIKKSPYGRSVIQSGVDIKQTSQGDVTLTTYSNQPKSYRGRGNRKRQKIDDAVSSLKDAESAEGDKISSPMQKSVGGGSSGKTDFATTVATVATAKTTAKKTSKKNNHGPLSFVGLCLALLYIMRVDSKRVAGRVVVPYCRYVAENIPQIKDLEDYDPRYQCKLITKSTETLKLAYRGMLEEHALMKEDLDELEKITYRKPLSTSAMGIERA